ncbi:transposase [Legionella sainthelensi]|uniref:transposase n=1 Tax=Legionella sainthelensi TaxID=28087 RepID=UPI00135B4D1D|nr:transposase [Legionella sainthelensi]
MPEFSDNCTKKYIAIMLWVYRDDLHGMSYVDFERIYHAHWTIERFHQAIKQVCNIDRFQVRQQHQSKTHIFCALKIYAFRIYTPKQTYPPLVWHPEKFIFRRYSKLYYIPRTISVCQCVSPI